MELQFKSLQTDVEDIDAKEGLVTAYWSAFGNRDSDGDTIVRGAYADTIRSKGPASDRPRIKMLWQHDPWEPIGVPTEMAEDDRGLRVTSKVAATTRGRDALILYDAGVLTEHSVGFMVRRRDDEDQGLITDIDLWEGSVVTWGANPMTPLVGLKGNLSDAPDRLGLSRIRTQTERMRKALRHPLTDETAQQVELALAVLDGQLAVAEKAAALLTDPATEEGDLDIGALFAKHLAA